MINRYFRRRAEEKEAANSKGRGMFLANQEQRRERLTQKWQEREQTFVSRAHALQSRFPGACKWWSTISLALHWQWICDPSLSITALHDCRPANIICPLSEQQMTSTAVYGVDPGTHPVLLCLNFERCANCVVDQIPTLSRLQTRSRRRSALRH